MSSPVGTVFGDALRTAFLAGVAAGENRDHVADSGTAGEFAEAYVRRCRVVLDADDAGAAICARLVELARRWYRYGNEAELAGAVREFEGWLAAQARSPEVT